MIDKLRKKFILVAMCSMAAVLTIIVGTLNLVSYRNMVDRADSILELLAENDAAFPVMPWGPEPEKLHNGSFSPQGQPWEQQGDRRMQGMSPETPYETRFFSVRFDKEEQIVAVDTGKIAAIVTEDAVAFAKDILISGRQKGFCENYRYKVVQDADAVMIVFIDRSRELMSFRTLATASVSVSLLGFLAVFVLVLIFSKKVFQPVAASYEKQKQFITDAGHELKTPLTIISANAEVLEMELEENNWITSIRHQVARLNTLVEQMVTLSRLDESEVLQDACDFEMTGAVQETVELFATAAENKEISLEFSAEEEYTCHGDENMIRRMVSLLMENAVKYTPEQGTIQVKLSTVGKRVQLQMWNTAENLPVGNLDCLFERFYRLDSSRNSKTGGSGIGLSIVKSIVEAHKGKINAKSEDGRSLRITIVL